MKKLLLLIASSFVALFCGVLPAHAAPVFDASSSYSTSTASTTFTFPFTVTSSANTILLVGAQAIISTTSSTGATYDGTPMTLLIQATLGGVKQAIYYLLNPISGTHNVTTTLTASTANVVFTSVSFANVLQIGNTTTTSSGGSVTSTNILPLSISPDTVVDFITAATSTFTATSSGLGWTKLFSGTYPAVGRGGALQYVTTSSPSTAAWAFGGGSNSWVETDVELKSSITEFPVTADVTIKSSCTINSGVTIQ